MNWKKIGKFILFPHPVILWLLLPTAVYALVTSMLRLEETDPLRIASYVLSAYTLTIWCARIPAIIRYVLNFKTENKYARRWFSDAHLRVNVTLLGTLAWNGAYASLQLGLGIYHHSLWFYSLAAYYFCLALMRFFLARYLLHHKPGEAYRTELYHYRNCGWIFLVMNLAMTVMIFLMIAEQRLVSHHEITTIALAAYTFTTLTMAIINVIRFRRYNSPVFSATKAISLASACVSMLTLEGTMLTTFRSEEMTPQIILLFLALTGAAISALVITMAIYMIVNAKKKLLLLENENHEE